MEITLQTKVADLLDAYPALEARLIEISPLFAKLKNPVLRRTVAKVATIRQIGDVAGIPSPELVSLLRQSAGLKEEYVEEEYEASESGYPSWFDAASIVQRIDIRPKIEAGESPMQEILKLSTRLCSGDSVLLLTPFKPVPLMDMLRKQGFEVWANGHECYFRKI
jgi:hypothetical protein